MPKLRDDAKRIWRAVLGIRDDVEDISSSVTHAVHAFPEPGIAEGPTEPIHPTVQFEHSDINAFGVVLTGVCVLVGSLILTTLLHFYFRALAHHRASVTAPPLPIAAHGNPLPPEPRIQEAPARDLARQRVYEDAVLNKYWWVDRNKGIVAMPIDRAMRILVERGIPPQSAPADLKLFPPSTGDRGVGFEDKVAPEPR